MNITNPLVEKYISDHTSPEDAILYELNRKTHLEVLQPRMLSGHYQGKILEFFSKLIKPGYILEIGTYTGYSAICLAKGLKEDGVLFTIEKNDELIDFAQQFFEKSGYDKKIKQLVGDALDILPDLNIIFDLVFIDGDKQNYCEFYNLIIDKVIKGGIIIVDNVLWDGKVLDNKNMNDPDTKSIHQFNTLVQHDNRVENILFPVRDGLMIVQKN